MDSSAIGGPPDRAGGRPDDRCPSQRSRGGPVRSRGSCGFDRSGRASPTRILFSRGAGLNGEACAQRRSRGLWYNIQAGGRKLNQPGEKVERDHVTSHQTSTSQQYAYPPWSPTSGDAREQTFEQTPARQLLFWEALRQNRAPPLTPQEHMTHQPSDMVDAPHGATMDRILQKILAVGRRLKGMDSRMISLTEETKSLLLDFAGFQSEVATLEQRVTAVETQATLTEDRDQELLYLCSKAIDLEDRNRRDNVHFLGFPEEIEGADTQSFLKNILPQLTGLAFDPPLEFQRAHRQGHKRREGANHQ
ncbi:hypothetical protein NDU88_000165 [Pleurodeles waltl]|uniref:Uncharacterized protein n=1 Tax=Pleurodeles waltl TaxID=8319 RepID=A0AAV7SVK3_PLEWA|nr:hypothetical protein NDU88_000165 [Pleurodeles waltl]